jgi:trimethylamine---corrinoid protein Co-methyltransferase
VRRIPVYDILPEEAIELIHDESCRILEEVGIEFRDDEAAAMWRPRAPMWTATA